MVRQDHVRGLALFDERADGAVDGMKLGFRKVDALPGRRAEFLVKALRDLGVVVILGLYGAEVPGPVAAVADVGCAVDPVAAFPFKASQMTILSQAFIFLQRKRWMQKL